VISKEQWRKQCKDNCDSIKYCGHCPYTKTLDEVYSSPESRMDSGIYKKCYESVIRKIIKKECIDEILR
jgi:hypothetical protein